MSMDMFSGFVVGNLAVVILFVVALLVRRKRGQVEQDERTALITAQSGAWAFYASAGVAYAGWVIDNALAFRRGEPLRFASPWGLMVLIMLVIWFISFAVQTRRFSADQWDEIELGRGRRAMVGLVGALGTLLCVAPIMLQKQIPELLWLWGGVMALVVGMLIWIGLTIWKQARRQA